MGERKEVNDLLLVFVFELTAVWCEAKRSGFECKGTDFNILLGTVFSWVVRVVTLGSLIFMRQATTPSKVEGNI